MQVEHEAISKAKKGDVIGLKVKKPVKEGASKEEADEIKKKLEEAGATVELQ